MPATNISNLTAKVAYSGALPSKSDKGISDDAQVNLLITIVWYVGSGTPLVEKVRLGAASLLAEYCIFVFIKSGASFSIASILYLLSSSTKSSSAIPFFNIKKVSSSTLFLSEDGKLNQTPPSAAS